MTDEEVVATVNSDKTRKPIGRLSSRSGIFQWLLPLAFFVGLLAPLLATSWYTLRLQGQQLEAGLQFEYDRMADVLANGMRDPLWNLLPQLGQPLLDSMMKDPRVISIQVISNDEGLFLEAGKDIVPIKPITLIRKLEYDGQNIGSVTIAIEASEIDTALQSQATRIYTTGFIQIVVSFLIVFTVYILLGRYREKRALQELNTQLEEQVDQRTRAYQRATEEALSANAAKSDFLSSMSHELRTPMHAILGFGQLLESNPQEPLTKRQHQAVDHILESGKHLLELIDQVLDLELIESGNTNLILEEIDIDQACLECLSLIDGQASKLGLETDSDLKATHTIRVDYTRFKQVLINLLINAAKYNRTGGRITLRSEDIAGNGVRVSVVDTGAGISKARQADLFEPFSRLGNESGPIKGTGIGLAISKKLVEAMGGEVGFTSLLELKFNS